MKRYFEMERCDECTKHGKGICWLTLKEGDGCNPEDFDCPLPTLTDLLAPLRARIESILSKDDLDIDYELLDRDDVLKELDKFCEE